MAAFCFGLFARVAGRSAPLLVPVVMLGGIVLIDLTFHQALSRAAVVAARSLVGSPVGKWFNAVAGSIMTVSGAVLLEKAMNR